MTNVPYSYFDAALTNSQPLRAVAVSEQPAAEATAPSTERLAAIDILRQAFSALPQHEQDSHVATMTTLNLRDGAAVSYIENIMSSSATGQGQANAQAVHSQAFNAGTSTFSPDSTAHLEAVARNLASQMMHAGASDKQIEQSVGNLPGVNLETQAVVQAAAKQVTEADKFNIFSTRNADENAVAPVAAVATIETASVDNSLLQNLLTGNIAKFDFAKDEELKRQGYRTHPGAAPAFATVNTTEAAIDNSYALLGDLSPTSGLPNLKGGPGRGGPDFS